MASFSSAPGVNSNEWYTFQSPHTAGTASLSAVTMYETSGGSFAFYAYPGPLKTAQVGSADFVFLNCDSVMMKYAFTAGTNRGLQGTLNLSRGAGRPASCNR